MLPNQNLGNIPPLRTQQFQPRTIQQPISNQWQSQQSPVQQQPKLIPPPASTPRPQTTAADTTTSVPPFNIPLLPAPPLPPEHIVTEQDRQTQLHYEQWLNHQNQIVSQQLKYYETEVQKLRKIKKSLNSKQRQLKKSNNELSEADQFELQRVTSEQAVLQKQLESSRKQNRQHGMLIQVSATFKEKNNAPKPQNRFLRVSSRHRSSLGDNFSFYFIILLCFRTIL